MWCGFVLVLIASLLWLGVGVWDCIAGNTGFAVFELITGGVILIGVLVVPRLCERYYE